MKIKLILLIKQNYKNFYQKYCSFCQIMKDTIKQNTFATSTSKQRWSFSKSRRFAQLNTKYDVGYYDKNSSLDKKSFSFGVGQRTRIIDKNATNVDPGNYNMASAFPDKKKGFTFGSSRQQSKFQNYLKMLNDSIPGKLYNLDETQVKKGKAFSIKQRTQYPSNYFLPNDPQAQRRGLTPGPSSYRTIDHVGEKCYQSKHKNVGQRFSNTQRFRKVKTLSVGPGSYHDRTITPDGQYVLSNMKSSGKRTIFKGLRKNIFVKTENVPGPGEYQLIGDFGKVINNQNILKSIKTTSNSLSRPQTARN